MNAKFLAVSSLSATRLDDVSLSGDAIHSFQLVDCRKSRLFSISARKTALYLAVSQKDLHPARKMALYLAVSQKNQFWPEILAFLWPSSVKAGWEGLMV